MEHESTLFESSSSMMSVGDGELSRRPVVREAITVEEHHINFNGLVSDYRPTDYWRC